MREVMPQMSLYIRFLCFLCLTALLLSLLPVMAQEKQTNVNKRSDSNQREQTDVVKEIEKLTEEIRQLRVELSEQRLQMSLFEDFLTFSPGLENQSEDYVEARSRFQTKLLRKGPSPQTRSPVKPPAGVTEIEYPSGELRLKAWVNRPSNENDKHPAVLFLHGGFAFYPEIWDLSKPYRDAGYVVMTPMFRGENGLPGNFSYFYDEVDDVLSAADYLSKQPYVDASRLFVAGHSNGGTLTLLAAMASRRFRAAASFDGAPFKPEFITSPNTLPFDTSDPRERQLRSPIAYANSFKCPVRIYYAEKDIFRLGSLRTAAMAKRRGLDVEAVEIEGDHDSHVTRAMMQSIAFFQKNSPPETIKWNGKITPLPKTVELDLGNRVKMNLVRIEPGKFMMGSPPNEAGRRDDELQHVVEIAKPYAIGAYEVTQSQYRQVMGMNPSYYSPKGGGRNKLLGLNTDDFPVENLTWEQAMDFCRIVSLLPEVKERGWIVDLPTEAEWEYAARAGTETAFFFGNSLSSKQANFNGNNPYGDAEIGPFVGHTTKVGSYLPNAWGLHDMHGNVTEWCKNGYDKEFGIKEDNSLRVARGGLYTGPAQNGRSARRRPLDPTTRGGSLGFRVVVRLREN